MTTGPDLIASRYRTLRELGRGGMGVVYLVEHVHTGERFALKLLLQHAGASAEIIERFRREARAPAKIKSDHVVKITDADVAPELGGAPFLVMELLEGASLDAHLKQRGSLAAAEVVWILRKVASALEKAHALGITHRDLKPENLFLHRREGEVVVKVLDFGISKISGEGGGDMTVASLTKSGAMMGTPLFMSPEQARGEIARIGPATDVWALGLIAYQLLTGRIYWQAQTLAMLIAQIVSMPMVAPSTQVALPAAFDAWFAIACHREPEQRFKSVRVQIDALARALGVDADASSQLSFAETMQMLPRAQEVPGSTVAMPEAGQTGEVFAHSQIGVTTAPLNRARRRKVVGAMVALCLTAGAGWGAMSLFAPAASGLKADDDDDASRILPRATKAPSKAKRAVTEDDRPSASTPSSPSASVLLAPTTIDSTPNRPSASVKPSSSARVPPQGAPSMRAAPIPIASAAPARPPFGKGASSAFDPTAL